MVWRVHLSSNPRILDVHFQIWLTYEYAAKFVWDPFRNIWVWHLKKKKEDSLLNNVQYCRLLLSKINSRWDRKVAKPQVVDLHSWRCCRCGRKDACCTTRQNNDNISLNITETETPSTISSIEKTELLFIISKINDAGPDLLVLLQCDITRSPSWHPVGRRRT